MLWKEVLLCEAARETRDDDLGKIFPTRRRKLNWTRAVPKCSSLPHHDLTVLVFVQIVCVFNCCACEHPSYYMCTRILPCAGGCSYLQMRICVCGSCNSLTHSGRARRGFSNWLFGRVPSGWIVGGGQFFTGCCWWVSLGEERTTRNYPADSQ